MAQEKMQQYLDNRHKGRPGQEVEVEDKDLKMEEESNFTLSFENFVLYPQVSLANVLYFSQESPDTYIT